MTDTDPVVDAANKAADAGGSAGDVARAALDAHAAELYLYGAADPRVETLAAYLRSLGMNQLALGIARREIDDCEAAGLIVSIPMTSNPVSPAPRGN